MIRKSIYYSGHVQGVGFRFTAQRAAMGHPVSGYVRNLSDGRVELVLEGDDSEIEKVLAGIDEQMGRYIKDVKISQSPATGEFGQFSIRH
jgi:acylphosphatase